MSNCLKENWIRSVIGGFLIHLVLGTLYLWGIITVPITSYLRKYNPKITYDDTILIYATALGAQGCTYILGGIIDKYLGHRRTCLFGGYILILGIFLSSFVTSLSALIFTYGAMFGMGLGFCYVPPMSCAAFWNPQRKGFITGTIVAGFGGGAFIFQFISTAVLHMGSNNSNNVKNQIVNGYYPPDSNIVANVPTMFLVLSACYFCCITLGSFLLVEQPRHQLSSINSIDTTKSTTSLSALSSINNSNSGGGGRYMTLKNDSSTSVADIDVTEDDDVEMSGNSDVLRRSNSSSSNPLHLYQPPPLPATSMHTPLPDNHISTSHSNSTSNTSTNNYKSRQQAQDSTKDTSSLLPHPQQQQQLPLIHHRNTDDSNKSSDVIAEVVQPSSPSSSWTKQQQSSITASAAVAVIDIEPLQMIRMPLCWHLTSCFVTTTIGGMYILGMFKVYGVAALSNSSSNSILTITNTNTTTSSHTTASHHAANDTELYLSQIGGIASLLNALGRIAWGELGDVLGPIETLMMMSAFFSLTLITYPFSPLIDGRFGFTLWTFLVFICEGGNFALYMTCVIQLFGIANSSANFGVVATVYALTNFLNIYTLSQLKVTFTLAAHLMGGLTFIGFINVCCLRIHERYYNNNSKNSNGNSSIESVKLSGSNRSRSSSNNSNSNNNNDDGLNSPARKNN